jgi:chromosomal replication initiation ATPase DnaA
MPREAPRQFPLNLPHEARLGPEDYLVAPANAAAHALVTAWPAWPDRAVLLAGPAGSGKSHLAAIWREASGAEIAPDAAAAAQRLMASPGAAILLDDADREQDERGLFHLLNAVREKGGHLLLTAASTPTLLWPKLPDLASRLRALPVAQLDPPDEPTMRAVLVKLLDDRQLKVEADVVEFIARRADRSLGAARALVEALDRESLARGRAVGRGLAADVIARERQEDD